MRLADLTPTLMDNYFIKVIFLLHATLVSLAAIAIRSIGGTLGYQFYNALFLLATLLAIALDKSAGIALVAASFNAICFALDIVFYFVQGFEGKMATLIIVFNLVFRILTTFFLLRNYSVRGEVEDPTSGAIEINVQTRAPRGGSVHQNICEPSQSVS